MIKFEAFVFVVLMAPLMAPVAAQAADPSEGRKLAQQWCASCHAIAPGQAAKEQVPTFEFIVAERGRSDDWLRTWLSTPHDVMPDLALTRDEIAALVVYFDSLRPQH